MSASMSHHSIPDYWRIFRLPPPLNKSKTKKFKLKKNIFWGISNNFVGHEFCFKLKDRKALSLELESDLYEVTCR